MEHLFRRHAGQAVARLTRAFGPAYLELAEDAVQDALVKALRHWSFRGPPANPGGWIYRVARNHAIDQLRRDRRLQPLESADEDVEDMEPAGAADFHDDQLALMFLCCHPAVSRDAAVALTLKTVCGFGVAEIAHAYFAEVSAIRQRLVRAKRALRRHDIDLSLPAGEALDTRLDAVLRALYLMFSDGYYAYQGDQSIKADVCAEAIRLTSMLSAGRIGDQPRTHALLALMLLQAARLEARTDATGELVVLEDQDRRQWNQRMLAQGLEQLARSAEGEDLSDYHLEAGIAACHAVAASVETTDWARIVDHYDLLWERTKSAVIALNRAVAVAHRDGPAAGRAALEAAGAAHLLANYHLYHATAGELARRCGDHKAAVSAFEQALRLSPNRAEQRLLERRIAAGRLALETLAGSNDYGPATTVR